MASTDAWVSRSVPYLKPSAASAEAWAEEAASVGRVGAQRLLYVGETEAPPAVAASLELAPGARVITRRRLILLDQLPVELADTFYPLEVARGTVLAEARKIKGGAVAAIASLGHVATRVIEDVTARRPAHREQELLALEDGEPVVVLERLTFNQADLAIQADCMVASARMRRLRYEMRVN